VISVARTVKAVEMTAACFTPMKRGIKDIETSPNPNPLSPCTNPAQARDAVRKSRFDGIARSQSNCSVTKTQGKGGI
jgi:hypothetical protein